MPGRHLADIAEGLAHLVNDGIDAARPVAAQVVHVAAWLSFELAAEALTLSWRLSNLCDRIAPSVVREPAVIDDRINVVRGGSC